MILFAFHLTFKKQACLLTLFSLFWEEEEEEEEQGRSRGGDRKRKKKDEMLQFALQAPDIGWSALCSKTLGGWKHVASCAWVLLGSEVGKHPLHCECFLDA